MKLDDAGALLGLLPLINQIGRPFLKELADIAASDECKQLVEACTDMEFHSYHRLISKGVPADHALVLCMTLKQSMYDALNRKKEG